ncbi:MAG: hypothetical protein ACRDCZ_04530 [Culicoidibacterales bacterium]
METKEEIKTKFESIKKIRADLERLNNAIEDSNNSIGQLEIMESNGMPRSNRTEAANDTHKKMERKLELLINQYSERVCQEQELVMEINELLIQAELDPVLDETVREYYIRPYYCPGKRDIFMHSTRSLACQMNTSDSTIVKRLQRAFEKIVVFKNFQQNSAD